jgi:hypothetical protein
MLWLRKGTPGLAVQLGASGESGRERKLVVIR